MASKHCMIQVSGTTYRIRSEPDRHHVFRITDDRRVGVFEHRPSLRVLESDVPAEQLLEIARAAVRCARLPWTNAVPEVHANARPGHVRTLASLLVDTPLAVSLDQF
jgi:hypothetical protein